MNPYDRAARLLQHFRALEVLLERERAQEWLRPIAEIVKALEPPFSDVRQCLETIEEAKRRFDSWHKSKGGFSEFYVHREDFKERLAANNELEAIRKAIYQG